MAQQQNYRWSIDVFDPRNMYPDESTLDRVREIIGFVQDQLLNDQRRYSALKTAQVARERDKTEIYLRFLMEWCEKATNGAARNGNQGVQNGQMQTQTNSRSQGSQSGVRIAKTPGKVESNYICEGLRSPGFKKCLHDYARNKHYVLVKKLQKTIYGSVRMARSIVPHPNEPDKFVMSNECVAIKIYEKEFVERRVARDGKSVQENPELELAIQQSLVNPGCEYVLPLISCLEDSKRIYAISPLVPGGELFQYVAANAPLPEPAVRNIMLCALKAVRYCHTWGICHRDISLENFLLGGEHRNMPILIDFGLAYPMVKDNATGKFKPIPHSGPLGKFNYMAPEMFLKADTYDGEKLDIWSLGVCMFTMLFGYPPWNCAHESDERFVHIVHHGNLRQTLEGWGVSASEVSLDLLTAIFKLNPEERPSIPRILQHSFFMNGSSMEM